MPKQTSPSTQERMRNALKRDERPENLKEQGPTANLKQNVNIPQHRTQNR